MTKKLSKKKLNEKLKSPHYNWKCNNTGTSITLIIKSTSYINALILISKIIVHTEVQKQFPLIALSHDKIKINLEDSSEAGLTSSIFNFARLIDQLILSTTTKYQ